MLHGYTYAFMTTSELKSIQNLAIKLNIYHHGFKQRLWVSRASGCTIFIASVIHRFHTKETMPLVFN